jgi:ribosomal protein S18 acetylase RimI-like enzyme
MVRSFYSHDAMRLDLTDNPNADDEAFVIDQTRAYNRRFVERDVQPLCVFVRNDDGHIIGGLTAKTYWQYLDISFLWVDEQHRKSGHATALMSAAEAEARRRGCKKAIVDTFSFQAPEFYRKLGYSEWGRLTEMAGQHERYFFRKAL